jgi:hypothetical protein
MSAITIGRCKDCKWRDGQICTNEHFDATEDKYAYYVDDKSLLYSQGAYGDFWVGPNFGCVNWEQLTDENRLSAEQQSRDLLERMEIANAQNFSAGELVELANLIAGTTVDYRNALFRVRDELHCGHVKNCPDAAHRMVTRLNDALAKIATLERKLSAH